MINPIRIITGIVLPLIVVGFVGVKVLGAKNQVNKAFDEVNRSLDPNAPSGGNDKDSLFRSGNLENGLGKVRAKVGDGGRLIELAIYPSYMVAQASTGKSDSGQAYKIQSDGKVIEIPLKLYGPGKLEDNVFPLAKVDTLVPEKMVEFINGQEPGTTLDNVSHVVLSIDVISGKPTWRAYLKSGSYYEAGFDGRDIHKGGQGTTPKPSTGSGSTAVGGN